MLISALLGCLANRLTFKLMYMDSDPLVINDPLVPRRTVTIGAIIPPTLFETRKSSPMIGAI